MEQSFLATDSPTANDYKKTSFIRDIFMENLESFYLERSAQKSFPQFVTKEVEDFLKCGVPDFGFIRLYCKDCKGTEVLAFSCKRRGFCPSSCGRRMNDTAIRWEENLFPQKPVRQWVLSFPYFIRYLMAYDPKVVSAILRIHNRTISNWYLRQPKKLKMKDLCKTGSVTVVQRFGAALNINPHFHSLFVDGYYYDTGEKLYFKGAVTPDSLELEKILKTIIKKSLRWLSRKGYIEGENLGEIAEQNPLSDIHGGSVSYKIASWPPVWGKDSVGWI